MTRPLLLGSGLITGLISIFVIQLVEACYFFFVYEFLDVSRSFKQWFAFTWWCALPGLIGIAASAVVILLNHPSSQAAPPAPLSLNALLLHFDPDDSGFSLVNSLSLEQVLTVVLMIIGAHTWSKRAWALDTVVVILPRLLIYAVWGWFVFLR